MAKKLPRMDKGNSKPGSVRTALLLCGGGLAGAMYEIGCLRALDESSGGSFTTERVDFYLGVSAGSVISALLANNISPRDLYDAVCDSNHPVHFRRDDIYGFDWGEFGRCVGGVMARTPRLLRYFWKNRSCFSFSDALDSLQELLPSGLFSLRNLEAFMRRLLTQPGRTNDFRRLRKKLFIPSFELDTGERWVFGTEGLDDVPISAAVAASSALPMFFQPFPVRGHDFVDGSSGHVAHEDVVVERGANRLVIINPTVPVRNDRQTLCIPTFDGHCATLRRKGLTFVSDQSRRIGTCTRLELALERLRASRPEIEIVLIQPVPHEATMFLANVMSYEARQTLLRYGYQTTGELLSRRAANLPRL